MSTSTQEVIDLTGDSSSPQTGHPNLSSGSRPPPVSRSHRPPRLVRDVVPIDDQGDDAGNLPSAGSPELEFMFSRTLLPTTMPQSRSRGARQLHVRRPGVLSRDSGSSVEQIDDSHPTSWAEWRNRSPRHPPPPAAAGDNQNPPSRFRTEYLPRLPEGQARHYGYDVNNIIVGLMNGDPMFRNADPGMNLPGELNFVAQGFQMGTHAQPAPPPPPPTYDQPSPPRAGYTRAPKEGDVLVCPNCEDELGVGSDEIKRQVWVIKKCGHVGYPQDSSQIQRLLNHTLGLLRRMYQKPAKGRTIQIRARSSAETVCQVRGGKLWESCHQPFEESLSSVSLIAFSSGEFCDA